MNKFLFIILFLLIPCISLTACDKVSEHVSKADVESFAENVCYEVKDGFRDIYKDVKNNFFEETTGATEENITEGNKYDSDSAQKTFLPVPDDANDLGRKKMEKVVLELTDTGFTNIQTIPVYDLDFSIIISKTLYGSVDEISIDGDNSFREGTVFEKNAEIIITYHLYEKDNPDIIFDNYLIKDLYDEYDRNPMRATDKYVGKHVAISGKITEIDSSGSYVLICAEDDSEGENYIYCHLNTDELKNQIYDLSRGDMLTVRGKTSTMTILNKYQIDVYSIQY